MTDNNWKKAGVFGLGLQTRSKGRKFLLGGVLEATKAVIPVSDSVIDIGASHGEFTRFLQEAGYDIFGIDGTPGIEEISGGIVKEHNILDADLIDVADWGIFINVGEHIPRVYEKQLVKSVCSMPRKGLIVAWSNNETPDRRAPNRRFVFYTASIFGIHGWLVDEELTLKAREIAGDYSIMNERLLVMTKESA